MLRPNSDGSDGNRNGPPRHSPATRPRWTACWLSGLVLVALLADLGCQSLRPKPETVYVPGTRQLRSLKAGEPAPEDGFFVPPAVMAELAPLLSGPPQAELGSPE